MKPVLLAICLLCTGLLHAQESLEKGFYINLNQDTIHGFFEINKAQPNEIPFYSKQDREAFDVLLIPKNVKQIHTDEQLFKAHIHQSPGVKQAIFLKRILKGTISLYKGHNRLDHFVFYLERPQHPLRLIPVTDPKPFLQSYFADCPEAASLKVARSQKAYSKMVTQMNRCIYNEGVELNKVIKTKREVRLGVGGFGYVGFPYIKKSSVGANTTVNGGFSAKLDIELYRRVGLSIGFNAAKKKFKSTNDITFVEELRIGNQIHEVTYQSQGTFDYSVWQIPIGFRLNLAENTTRWNPYAGAGIMIHNERRGSLLLAFDSWFNLNTSQSGTNLLAGMEEVIGEGDLISDFSSLSLWANFGFHYKLNDNFFFSPSLGLYMDRDKFGAPKITVVMPRVDASMMLTYRF